MVNASLESLIEQWHLREQVDALMALGLDAEEAFLVALKRTGNLDAERLFVAPAPARTPKDAIVAWCLGAAAAVALKLPVLFGIRFAAPFAGFWIRNATLFVLPLLTAYFVWKRRADRRTIAILAVAFLAGAILANAYPFRPAGATTILTGLHLPIALWLFVGIAYTGTRPWMDFIRFSGELLIYYALIALGGGVFTVCLGLIFHAIGINPGPFIHTWLLPCGAAGAVLVASWLVEAKQSVMENMAPVLTRLFTPLFAALLLAFLGTLLWTGRGVDVKREVLIVFDLLLIVVLGLHLYSVSARDAERPPNFFDGLQVVLVVSALAADAVALWAIGGRIQELGFTPNRTAALGVNLILLVNLAWSAVLSIRFLRRAGSFHALERWQTKYLPVYAVWAAIVVIVFPPAFGFI